METGSKTSDVANEMFAFYRLLLRFRFEGFRRYSVFINSIRTLVDLFDAQCAQS